MNAEAVGMKILSLTLKQAPLWQKELAPSQEWSHIAEQFELAIVLKNLLKQILLDVAFSRTVPN